MAKEEKEKVDQLLFDLFYNIEHDLKGKIKYDDFHEKVMDVRIKIQMI